MYEVVVLIASLVRLVLWSGGSTKVGSVGEVVVFGSVPVA